MARLRLARLVCGSVAAAAALTGCGADATRPHTTTQSWQNARDQAIATATFTAINTLDCDYGYDVLGGETCTDDDNYINMAPHLWSVTVTPQGRFVVRLTIYETTKVTVHFRIVITPDGRRVVNFTSR